MKSIFSTIVIIALLTVSSCTKKQCFKCGVVTQGQPTVYQEFCTTDEARFTATMYGYYYDNETGSSCQKVQ